MTEFRTFRNADPPHLAEVWNSQPPQRGLRQPLTAEIFECQVLSKPYFDNAGLIVAVSEGNPVGFAHAGFGASDDESRLSTRFGVVCLVMVHRNFQRQGIGAELVNRSEQYLKRKGATVLYAGGVRPLNAFYLGLYGGSELPGVLESDTHARGLFVGRGYREIERSRVLQCDLARFRPVVDRKQLQVRRQFMVTRTDDPPTRTWWEACTLGSLDRMRFDLSPRAGGASRAQATFWTMPGAADGWGTHTAGLIDLEVAEGSRRQGLASMLLAEAFRALGGEGAARVEVQTMQHNTAALALYQKLGFTEVDEGIVYRQQAS